MTGQARPDTEWGQVRDRVEASARTCYVPDVRTTPASKLTTKIAHPVFKAVIHALQSGGADAWSTVFEPGATLYHDARAC